MAQWFEDNSVSATPIPPLRLRPPAKTGRELGSAGEYRDDVGGGVKLDPIVAQLHSLREASQRQRYRAATPQLPSFDAMVGIVDGLMAVLFPRHFGPPGLAPHTIDDFVRQTLVASLRSLQKQVRLELAVAREWNDFSTAADPGRAAEIIGDYATVLPSIRSVLETDIRAAYERDPSAKSIDEIVFCFPSIAAIARHRLAHHLYRLGVPMLARMTAELAHSQTGIDIHPGARIGQGFFIDHGTGVVIGETAIIGRNVQLHQGVTLGAMSLEHGKRRPLPLRTNDPRHPIIEDDVVIYAGATVLGRVTIGHGSVIGGNVWLTHSVPPGSHIIPAVTRNNSTEEGEGL
jgi:serine O-acetyltransferase